MNIGMAEETRNAGTAVPAASHVPVSAAPDIAIDEPDAELAQADPLPPGAGSESEASGGSGEIEKPGTTHGQGWLQRDAHIRHLRRLVRDILEAVAQVHRRELRGWEEAIKARSEASGANQEAAPRLSAELTALSTSMLGWLKAPVLVWKELARLRTHPGARNGETDVGCAPPISLSTAKRITVPLTLKAQRVVRPPRVDAGVLWATLLAEPGLNATVEVIFHAEDDVAHVTAVNGRGLIDRQTPVRRRIQLYAGRRVRLMEFSSSSPAVSFEVRRAAGAFGVLAFEESILQFESQASERGQDTGSYGDHDGSVASAAGSPVAHWSTLTHSACTALELEYKLWGGYARYALPALESLKCAPNAPVSERESAAWSLVRWFSVHEDYARALENVEYSKRLTGRLRDRIILAEVQCLLKLGRYERALAVTEQALEIKPKLDLLLLKSSVVRRVAESRGCAREEAEEAQLDILNEVFRAGDLAPLEKRVASEPLSLANITARAEPVPPERQILKVSVVVPAFNAAETIAWVLQSLLEQTWQNLEIIVVDDKSTDNTCEIVESISRADPRVRLIRQPVNGGAYPARNAGARHAVGDLIMIHDSDDWSHPQKIQVQVETLQARPELVAVKSNWVRVGLDLEIVGPWRPRETLFDHNFSALMFRRSLLETTGLWDEVLVSGDAEFYSRLRALYGEKSVAILPHRYLLSLSLTRENSLTRSKATHLRTLSYGLRWNYRDAYMSWHADPGLRNDLPFDPARNRRRFPIPIGNRPERSGKRRYDLIVISDFAEHDGAQRDALEYLAAARSGKRVAVFHWRRYELNVRAPLGRRFYEICLDLDIDILSPGDSAASELVLIVLPAILQHRIEPIPEIEAARLAVIVDQLGSDTADGTGFVYDPITVRSHLMSIFGTEGVWIPTSARIRRRMLKDERYPRPFPTTWWRTFDTSVGRSRSVVWRGEERAVPLVGRQVRTRHPWEWPAKGRDIAAAYGADQRWDVRFLGDIAQAVRAVGFHPQNWNAFPIDGTDTLSFLSELDFYVYYTHEARAGELDESVLTAMALGVPVVLPRIFEAELGSAALYADPAEVSEVVTQLWASRERYVEQAERGRAFTIEQCDHAAIDGRLASLFCLDERRPVAEAALSSANQARSETGNQAPGAAGTTSRTTESL